MSSSGGDWIAGAIGNHPGRLHKELGVPLGKKIPVSRLDQAAKKSKTKIGKRARLALTLESFHHGMDGPSERAAHESKQALLATKAAERSSFASDHTSAEMAHRKAASFHRTAANLTKDPVKKTTHLAMEAHHTASAILHRGHSSHFSPKYGR